MTSDFARDFSPRPDVLLERAHVRIRPRYARKRRECARNRPDNARTRLAREWSRPDRVQSALDYARSGLVCVRISRKPSCNSAGTGSSIQNK